MRASYTLVALASALPVVLAGATASAHVNLISPPARLAGEAGNQLKTKPCGQSVNGRTTDKVTTFTPGQKVDIKMKEFVNHPGYFALAFDPDGDDNFPFPRANMDKVVAATDDPKAMFPLSDTILGIRTDKDKDCYTEAAGDTHECTISITIPNVNCQNCTLQVTQFMYDKLGDNNDNEYYYQCADIKIEGPLGGSGGAGGSVSGGAAGAGGVGGGGGTGTSAAGGSAGTSTGTSTGGTPTTGGVPGTAGAPSTGGTAGTTTTTGGAAPDDGGCSIAKRSQGAASALAALGILFALGRRRRALT